MTKPFEIIYTTTFGESIRMRIRPERTWFGPLKLAPEPQWQLTAWDVDAEKSVDLVMKHIAPVR